MKRRKRYPYRTSVVVNGHRYDIKAKTRQEMMEKVDAKRNQDFSIDTDTAESRVQFPEAVPEARRSTVGISMDWAFLFLSQVF